MKYVIVPDASDYNRGDQALVWEAIKLAQDAGFNGQYYIQADKNSAKQSVAKGYECFEPLLPHPSRNKRTNNVHYGASVLIKWGLISIWDLIRSLYVLLIANCPALYCTLPSKTRKSAELFKDSNALIVKGGGFLHAYGNLTAPYFIYFHLYSIFFANRIGLPVYIMPNSFGPLDGFLVKWQVRKALSKCRLIYCREPISFDYMKKTFPDITFKKTFDLGFYLAPQQPISDYNFWPDKKTVAITVRPYRFPEHDNGEELYQKYIGAMVGFCKHIIDNGFYPVLLQHTLAVNTHEDDMTAIQDIVAKLPEKFYGIFSDESYDCCQLKAIYASFDYIVGTRFHSVIFSLASYVPAVSIAYGGNKSRGIMKDIGLEDYVVDIDKVTTDTLIELFESVVAHTKELKAKLSEIMIAVENERNQIVKDLITSK